MVMKLLKRLFDRNPLLLPEQAERISSLPPEQARRELAAALYKNCEKLASEFVSTEMRRGDSPFSGISAAVFFHEMLTITLWLMDREITDGKMALAHDLHDHYFRSFSVYQGTPEERNNALKVKYRKYEDTWDEITGHQDEFGLLVTQNLFGTEEHVRTRERTFWIISYSHDIARKAERLHPLWKKIVRKSGKPAQ